MVKSSFIDFKAVQGATTMEQVLEHYRILNKFKRSGELNNVTGQQHFITGRVTP